MSGLGLDKPSALALTLAASLACPALAAEPDIASGRLVAVGGVKGGPGNACFTCHGIDGVGDATGGFPRLAGQAAFYLYKQLKDYASGTRPNAIMTPIAQALTDAQMEDVAAYYAAQDAPYAPRPQADPATLRRGAAVSTVGAAEQGVQACINCHGPRGIGLPPSLPYLAGQYAQYLELQLMLWRQGVRNNGALGVMEAIAKSLTEEQIRAVSLYFESVRPWQGEEGEGAGAPAAAAQAGR